ncbi:MAG: flippase [Anaerolineae bacterium]|nr:flippase [Anaerolineae bacterium]
MNAAKTVSRNFAIMLVSNILTRLMSILYVAVLARYIGADGMGHLSTATAVVSLLILLVNFGFDTHVTREVAADETKAPEYIANVAFLRLILTAVLAAALAVIALGSPYPAETRIIIVIYALVYVLDNFSLLARAIFHAFQRMEYEFVVELARAGVNVGVSLLGIHWGWSLTALVLVSLAASLIKLILSVLLMRRRLIHQSAHVDLAVCRRILLTSLPFFLLMAANVAHGQIHILALSVLDTQSAVGIFSAAMFPITMLFALPLLFSDAVFPLFSREAHHASQHLTRAYVSAYKLMILMGLPLGAGVMLVSRQMIDLLYGSGYELAIPVLCLLAVQLMTMVGYVNGALLNALHRQSLFMRLRLLLLAFSLLLCALLIPAFGVLGAALACAVPALIDFVFYSWLCHRLLKIPFTRMAVHRRTVLAALLMSAACWISLKAGVNVIVVIILPGAALYALLLGLFNILDAEEWAFIGELGPVRRLRRRLALAFNGGAASR